MFSNAFFMVVKTRGSVVKHEGLNEGADPTDK